MSLSATTANVVYSSGTSTGIINTGTQTLNSGSITLTDYNTSYSIPIHGLIEIDQYASINYNGKIESIMGILMKTKHGRYLNLGGRIYVGQALFDIIKSFVNDSLSNIDPVEFIDMTLANQLTK